MRKLVVNTFMTLDGVMQAPGGPPEDPSGGFTYGGWSVNYWDDVMGQTMGEFMGKPFDLILGRKTYEIFAAHWPYSNEPGADQLNNAKKYVASRTLNKVDWNNSALLKEDVVQEIRKLKEQDGPELQVHGSSNFIQTLLKHNRMGVPPDSKTSSTGVIMATYEPAGELRTGTFELENPSEVEIARRERLREEG